jgi:Ni/Fe-hydrogenase 1 B-type cytochrome subunit
MTTLPTQADLHAPDAGPPANLVRPTDQSLPPMMERVRVYVWEIPVRVTHWVTFAALVVLTITGSYIADPFLFTPGQDTMRLVRFIHLVAAYSFVASGILRTYWLFAGNQFARWSAFVPTNRRHLREVLSQTQFYLFLRKDLPGILGHNALASGTYTVVFFLFLVQTLTGFALVGIHGTQPWATIFGWVPSVMFGEQGVRVIHHLLMWAIVAFAIHHVYSAILVDHLERNGLMSSIFAGSKYVPRWRVIEARDGGIELDSLVSKKDVEESRAEALATALRSEE